ncbi:MAG TPA: hypothetical protein VJ984_06355 [Xanthomonadales bacterium]|nr:hypothetical protein [Xanthomonadales bacterium]
MKPKSEAGGMKRSGILLLSAMLVSCSQPLTTEQIIISRIRSMEAQIEEGERRRFMTNIAEDFRSQNGQMNRDQLRTFVVLQLTRYENLNAQLFPINVQQVNDQEAMASFNALLTGGPGWFPEDGQLYRFETFWKLEEEEWLLASAGWEPIRVGELVE